MHESQVSACLVTRGDQPEQMERILGSLLDYDEVIVWDNSQRHDYMTNGRYHAMLDARNNVCYTQDDDVLVPRETQRALLAAWEPDHVVATYAHGEDDGGYGDMAMVGGGALLDRWVALDAIDAYHDEHGWGRDEDAYADFLVGVQIPFKHIPEGFEINYEIAQHPSRLVNQPWAADAKRRVTERARALRVAV